MRRLFNRKTLLIFLLIGIILPVVMAITFVKQNGKVSEPGTPVPITVVPKQISSDYPQNINTEYTFKIENLDLPTELSTLEIATNPPIPESDVFAMAKAAGFSDNYRKLVNGEGQRIYLFYGEGENMSIRADVNEISYRTNYATFIPDKNLSDDKIKDIAVNFLKDKFKYDENKLNFSFIAYYQLDDEATSQVPREKAEMFKVNFNPTSLDYKLLTLNPQESPVSVWVKRDGTIAKAELSLIKSAKLSDKKAVIKNFEEVKASIGNSTLVNISYNETILANFNSTDITKIVIDKIEIAYFADSPTSTNYLPVFLMEGTATIPKIQQDTRVTLYLPALK
jgi:hypothetical protein